MVKKTSNTRTLTPQQEAARQRMMAKKTAFNQLYTEYMQTHSPEQEALLAPRARRGEAEKAARAARRAEKRLTPEPEEFARRTRRHTQTLTFFQEPEQRRDVPPATPCAAGDAPVWLSHNPG